MHMYVHKYVDTLTMCVCMCRFVYYIRPYLRTDLHPKGPCTEIVDTLPPKYLYRDYFNAKVYTIWVHGPLGLS